MIVPYTRDNLKSPKHRDTMTSEAVFEATVRASEAAKLAGLQGSAGAAKGPDQDHGTRRDHNLFAWSGLPAKGDALRVNADWRPASSPAPRAKVRAFLDFIQANASAAAS